MVSLAASIQPQNLIDYCIKVHKTGSAGKESNSRDDIECLPRFSSSVARRFALPNLLVLSLLSNWNLNILAAIGTKRVTCQTGT